MSKNPLRVAIIGTAKRSDYLYGPLVHSMRDEVELVSVWGRGAELVQRLSQSLAVPGYTDMDKLVRETAPEIGIVSVNYHANGEVGLMAVQAGLHVLLETPIAHKLSEADAIIAAARERGLKIEIAEQFHRRPLEQIKLKLIESGLFGRVHSSFSDFAGHGYHGMSVMRSYLGFNAKPILVTGTVRQYDLAPHWARLSETRGARTETQEHGIIEFDGGQVGIFHWTDVAYDFSPALVAQQPLPGGKGHGNYGRCGIGCGGAPLLAQPGRGSAAVYYHRAPLGTQSTGGHWSPWWPIPAIRICRS